MPQTSYLTEHVAANAGGLADSDLNRSIIPMRNNEAVDLPFGLFVAHDLKTGTSEIAAKIPEVLAGVFSDKLMGASVLSLARVPGPIDLSGVNGVRANDMFNVLRQGAIYVLVEEAVTPSSPVFVRVGPSANGLQRGATRASADAVVAWGATTAYILGDIRTNDTNKVYRVTTAGTSAGAGGPTGTGSAITDGSVVWEFLGLIVTSGLVSAVAVPNARFESSAAAGEVAKLVLNLP